LEEDIVFYKSKKSDRGGFKGLAQNIFTPSIIAISSYPVLTRIINRPAITSFPIVTGSFIRK
jgi:hypothetical protein